MIVNPKTEEELNTMTLIQPGVYNFQVIDAKDKISKKGHEMIELKLTVWDNEGRERIVFDYLLDAMAHKVRHFAECTGLIDKYNLGTIMADDCINKSGKIDLIIQDGQPKPEGGFYPDKNSVKDYVKSGVAAAAKAQPPQEAFHDDELPF